MRKGEEMALTWNDVNLKDKQLTINKTRNYFGTGPAKTAAGNRTIAIPDSLVKLLKKYSLYQRAKYLKLKVPFAKTEPVFTNSAV